MKKMKVRIAYYLILSVLLLNFGCATTKPAQKPATSGKERLVQKPVRKLEKPQVAEAEEAKEKTIPPEFVSPPEFRRLAPPKKLPPSMPIDPSRLALSKGVVMINVEKMPLPDFIIYALGETLRVSFVMDQKVMDSREPITFSMKDAVPSEQALEMVLGIFEKYNLYVEEKAGALYIFQKLPEPKQPFDIKVGKEMAESPAPILQVVPLKHIKPADIEVLIKELYKTGVQIRPYPRENVLLLYGQAIQIKQIMELINTFDVPYLQDKKIAILKLTYWPIDDFIKQLSQILESLGFSIAKSPKEPGILFIPIKPLKSLMVIATDDKSLKYVLDWRERLDKPDTAGGEERPFTYIPKYSRASDLVKSIKNLYGIMPAAQPTPTTSTAPGRAPAAQQPSSVTLTGLRISSDDQRNIIMIVSSPAEYKNILSLIEDLDVPPRQVLIEATVAEFTLTDDLSLGLEWRITSSMLSGTWKGTFNLGTTFGVPTGPGLVYQFITDTQKFNTLINAYASENRVNILSNPRLVVLDNQEATIQVGTDVPIVTGEISGTDITTPSSVLRNIQYRSTGVILRVKPTINTQGLLTLNISQEVSEMGAAPPTINSPTILTRRITTSVVAGHGQSVALGGLISENISRIDSKVPYLGDIPILGALFRTSSKTKRKTELLVLITPTILTSVDDTTNITRELREEFKWLK
jgi:general secretion pathway protein D